jgi:iron complex outermembrane recepter protein
MKDLYDGEEAGAGFSPVSIERCHGWPLISEVRSFARSGSIISRSGRAASRDRARLVANTFLMLFDDEIVPSGGLDQFGVPRTGNAERTRHMGVELEAEAIVADGLTLVRKRDLEQKPVHSLHGIRSDGRCRSVGTEIR